MIIQLCYLSEHGNKLVEKILQLRRKYHFVPIGIVWYLERYHGIRVSDASVYRTLRRNRMNRVPGGIRTRKTYATRYNKQIPGRRVQKEDKFLVFRGKQGQKIKRYQFTAIEDATRVRAMKVYKRHTQASAINFVNFFSTSFHFGSV